METYEVITWETMGKTNASEWVEVDKPTRVRAGDSYEAAMQVSRGPLQGIHRPQGPGVFFKDSKSGLVYEVLSQLEGTQMTPELSKSYWRAYRERRGG